MRITPAPFVKRNIFCGNRLYQNKYEMSAWPQEARSMGITDPERSGATLVKKRSAFTEDRPDRSARGFETTKWCTPR